MGPQSPSLVCRVMTSERVPKGGIEIFLDEGGRDGGDNGGPASPKVGATLQISEVHDLLLHA